MRTVYAQYEDNYKLFTFQDYLEAGKPVVVPTNCTLDSEGRLVMGAGLAKLVADRFPDLPSLWAEKPLGEILFTQPEGRVLIRFATKYHYKDRADLGLIGRSARKLRGVIDQLGFAFQPSLFPIYIPQVGCGLGGLDWAEQVYPLLDKIFGDDPRYVCDAP